MTFYERLKITLQYLFILFICLVVFFGMIFSVLYIAFVFCSNTTGICVDLKGGC